MGCCMARALRIQVQGAAIEPMSALPMPSLAFSWVVGDNYPGRRVAAARDVNLWEEALRQQIYLGDDVFIERMQGRAKRGSLIGDEILLAHRRRGRWRIGWPTPRQAEKRCVELIWKAE